MPAIANRWYVGARPRTLPAAIVPVIVGTGVAAHGHDVNWWRFALTLVVALAIQVGTNYANDYSDGVKGTDVNRIGPLRLVASGLATRISVKRAAFMAFGLAASAGVTLAFVVGPVLPMLATGAVCIAAGWFYTGGKHPYGYSGFGELSVFVFFGLVAVCGTEYLQVESISGTGFAAGCSVGLLAVALLAVNNLRDIETDRVAGKKTLAVRLGALGTRGFYAVCVFLSFVIAAVLITSKSLVAISMLAILLAVSPLKAVVRGDNGRDLIPVLQATARLQLVFGTLFAVGLWL